MESVLPGVARVAVRTPTLPPATHTNSWVLGEGALTVVDPASPWEDEQERLLGELLARIDAGERVERLLLTHHHLDHVSGARALRDALRARGHAVAVAAHPRTADRVAVPVDELVPDGAELLPGVRALHTPGHAPGHLALVGPDWIVAGDLVAGVGTILLDPRDGDLDDYLASLAALAATGRSVLLPAHGPALPEAATVLAFYVAHRHQRTDQVRRALDAAGRATPRELAGHVYPELPPAMHAVAALQIETHLRSLVRHGLARVDGDHFAR